MPRAVVIIPARFGSTRLPGKPLALLKGKPLIQVVHERVLNSKLIEDVIIATDDRRVLETVESFGGKAVMTSPDHASGTDRVAEAAKEIECDIIVNVQGDEPFVGPDMIDDSVRMLLEEPKAVISTFARKTSNMEEILSPDVVKVVMDDEGFAMYFSRAPIPFYRDEWRYREREQENQESVSGALWCHKHIGIYGYRKDALMRFCRMMPGRLEQIERLEQLRALAAGMRIKVKESDIDTLGVDTAEDLRKAEQWLSSSS